MSERQYKEYVRCVDCLAVSMITEPLDYDSRCGVCGGQIESMGKVKGERLVEHGVACSCDERCASATGPHCSCRCGGQFHGLNMFVPVTRDRGPVPVITPQQDAAKLLQRAAEYRAMVDTLSAARPERWTDGTFLPYAEFLDQRRAGALMYDARSARVHKSRMAKLDKIAAILAGYNSR